MRVLALLAAALIAGCAIQERPFTYTDQREMAGRPGLFTGKTGAVVLYRNEGGPLLSEP